ncbi:reverse transcriptase domain-containing protein [Tanacetum coccineum]|uniref:Reverse transcriptase domain-containing protein n=1 Tax=Tanacetum coccineum TaxID=301880 RepID=A0ABQ5B694_9ASTR
MSSFSSMLQKDFKATWAIELGEHDIEFKGHNSVKGKILADFLAETPFAKYKDMETKKLEAANKEPKSESTWKLYTDRASSSDGLSAGLMLVSPKGKEYMYALKFEFKTTNNEVEYEALLVGLRIEEEMEIRDLAIFIDSQLVANQVKGLFEARQPVIKQYLEKTKEVLKNFNTYSMKYIRRNQNKKTDALSKLAFMTFKHLTKGMLVEVLANMSINSKEVSKITAETKENWMTPIYEYLLSGLLPEDPKEAKKAKNVIQEIHEGSCGFNVEPCSIVVKVMKQGYYWPSIYRDAAEAIQYCTRFQTYSIATRMPMT